MTAHSEDQDNRSQATAGKARVIRFGLMVPPNISAGPSVSGQQASFLRPLKSPACMRCMRSPLVLSWVVPFSRK